MNDQAADPTREAASELRKRALSKLLDVKRRTPEVEARTRRLVHWGEMNGFAPKIHQALKGGHQ